MTRRVALYEFLRVRSVRSLLCVMAVVPGIIGTAVLVSAPRAAGATPVAPSWMKLNPPTSVPIRGGAAIAYDGSTGQLILFGGLTGNCSCFPDGTVLNDTWNWNGNAWVQLHPATSPSVRSNASLTYDPGTGQLILFGGMGMGAAGDPGGTWDWNGSNWERLHPATSPPVRAGAAMVYDASANRLILFGGFGLRNLLADTWSWDGSNWNRVFSAQNPSPRYAPTMAYDPTTQSIVLFGGLDVNNNALGDTWSWSNGAWSRLTPPSNPPPSAYAPAVFDPNTGTVILVAQSYPTGGSNTTWSWNGSTWIRLFTPSSPTTVSPNGMVFDPVHNALVLEGPQSNGSTTIDSTFTYGVPPFVGIATVGSGTGYLTTDATGDLFPRGSGTYHGSTSGVSLNAPVVGVASTSDSNGYWLAGSDGG
ncbi:MAG: hypothetical protein M1121_03505, partial [Actinobacteria bacterium]|nr:hypothetical protein [Actinomycetota bacterium]